MDFEGHLLQSFISTAVNTNFVPFDQAQQAVLSAVKNVLDSAGAVGDKVNYFVSSLVGPRFGKETFSDLCPNTVYLYYPEMSVVFAQAGIYHPHGVGVVAATGATSWGVRADDGRQLSLGGWGSLLGDEGSAYAMGLSGLRAAACAYEKRAPVPTLLVEAISQHFNLDIRNFQKELVFLAYQKPLSRAEIASVAMVVTHLAEQNDAMALRIVTKVANDLAELILCAARRIFSPDECFDVVVAGGLINAGELILRPIRPKIIAEFPKSILKIGAEIPAVALGHLALYNLKEVGC